MAQQDYMATTPYSRTGAAAETVGSAGTKAIKYGLLTALGVTAALIGGGFGVGLLMANGGIGGVAIPTAAWVGAGVGGVLAAVGSTAIGGISIISGLFGGAKGAREGAANVREHNAGADMAQAQLQTVAIEAQTRAMEAQARIADAQARMQEGQQQNVDHKRHQHAPAHMQAAQHIQGSNDNQLHGTVEQAQQQQLGA